MDDKDSDYRPRNTARQKSSDSSMDDKDLSEQLLIFFFGNVQIPLWTIRTVDVAAGRINGSSFLYGH